MKNIFNNINLDFLKEQISNLNISKIIIISSIGIAFSSLLFNSKFKNNSIETKKKKQKPSQKCTNTINKSSNKNNKKQIVIQKKFKSDYEDNILNSLETTKADIFYSQNEYIKRTHKGNLKISRINELDEFYESYLNNLNM